MVSCDLHVHSKYSDHPTEWFLRRLGAAESYTDPVAVYRTAKRRGMDYVTLTDHNRIEGSLLLRDLHPEDSFTGVESTAYFPEDRCKVHILIYDITMSQFEEIQYLRTNIYELRDFFKTYSIAHSVAHATYSLPNGFLTREHLEKLILMFDTFETINGGRNRRTNENLAETLRGLSEVDIERMYSRHRIDPFGQTPWIKRQTAGSDDHAGLFIGKTYTTAESESSLGGFLETLRLGSPTVHGRHHNHSSMAFAIYKIAYEFAKSRQSVPMSPVLALVDRAVFGDRRTSSLESTFIRMVGRMPGEWGDLRRLFAELVEELRSIHFVEVDQKIDALYDRISVLADSLLAELIDSVQSAVRTGDLGRLPGRITSALPLLFLSAPFVSTFSNMNVNRDLAAEVGGALRRSGPVRRTRKRILWFTDTITDLNGVADSLREMADAARRAGHELMIAASLTEHDREAGVPQNTMDLPLVTSFPLPGYERLTVRIPSVLRTLKLVTAFDPDEVFISSPSVVGLVGLLVGRLLKVRCVGVYHTDFTLQVSRVINDTTLTQATEAYTRWFYASCTEVLVNTEEYKRLLVERGYQPESLKLLRRGIDTGRFIPDPGARSRMSRELGLSDRIRLLYAGRVSKDKSVDLVIDAVQDAFDGDLASACVELIIVGDGPDLAELRDKYGTDNGITFTGRVPHDSMPWVYAGSDAFLFASETDTFGRVVAEAQSCGIPAVVGPIGGPKELVVHGETGWIVPESSVALWSRQIKKLVSLIRNDPRRYESMCRNARRHAEERFSLDAMVSALFVDQPPDALNESQVSSEEHADDHQSAAERTAASQAHAAVR